MRNWKTVAKAKKTPIVAATAASKVAPMVYESTVKYSHRMWKLLKHTTAIMLWVSPLLLITAACYYPISWYKSAVLGL